MVNPGNIELTWIIGIAIIGHQLLRPNISLDIRPIRTDEDHRAALCAIDAFWGAPEGTEEGDKLDVLTALVEIYEAKRWPIELSASFDPIDVLHLSARGAGHIQAELWARSRVRPKF